MEKDSHIVSAEKKTLGELIRKAIEQYNRYRGAEGRAKLLRIVGNKAVVLFKGSFTETCGINDWVEDLRYVMEDLGIKVTRLEVIEPDKLEEFYDYRIGVFHIQKHFKQRQ